jgi:transposase
MKKLRIQQIREQFRLA